jgi:hypothetical protein
MHPNPQKRNDSTDSGRIIYLGDVRKKRRQGSGRQAPDRYYIAALALLAAMSWGAWMTVLTSSAPAKLLTYVAFLLPLALALASTGTIVFYGIDWRRGLYPSLRVCGRRAVLAAAVVVINLACLGAHFWLIPVGAVTIAAAVLAEIAFSNRH